MIEKRSAFNMIALLGLAVYLTLAAISFVTFVEPSLKGTSEWRVYADSTVYMEIADDLRLDTGFGAVVALLTPSRNVVFPALVALVLKTSANIAILNVSLFLVGIGILAWGCRGLRWYVFLPLLLVHPTTYQALLTLNKEIFTFFSAVVFVKWLQTKSSWLITMLIVVSFFLRWEQCLALVCFLVLRSMGVGLKRASLAIIVTISIAYPFAIASVGLPATDTAENAASIVYMYLNRLQLYGLYFALILPKLAITLLSQVIRCWVPFIDEVRLHDLPTGLFVLGEQLCMCILAFRVWRQKLWSAKNPIVYFSTVYCIIFLAAPLNSPRYLYLLYVLLAALLSSRELQSLRNPEKTSRTIVSEGYAL